ncbi:adenosylmethionine--8-amino-7-oxononanoate transaminase [Aurantiacibacter sp. MUD11]|uniref:adenosylmethionine--8-amino-7-oxononanoate transaminase n=1 Tax=Aurantiacibacter sp. MUD11 TaxID=3003265 RepID=UPI0022AA3B8C|nr:adenosylmethionine--8-amino-7-oxononanoate transaminase [Aurantiacibacter sp. MUD11]WAT16701.1 adenosylmethionine--8-amino-7-oxononanoate transaminase [Aurantiacibacter sp. MUD11]
MSKSPVWHPFHQHGLEEPIPLVTHAEGAALYTDDGRRVIDAISSWWVTTHGHNHPHIMAAIREQTEKLDQLIFAGWTHEPAETLARGLVDLMPDGLDHVFYSDSGSTAVEVALKMALGYWHNRAEPRSRILVLEHSYHGDTIGAMSVGARGVFNRAYEALLFDVGTVPFPGANPQPSLDALEAACAAGDVAAFIVEPLLLGAGGMLVYPPQVLAEMRTICARHGVLFIADEVMTGWGRTGTLLACEQAQVTPDILCLAKGLTGGAIPLAATLASGAVYNAHYSTDRSRMFFHSSSFTANPIACAAANANLAIWQDEDVRGRIDALSRRLGKVLDRLAQRDVVTNPRQCGTMIAFDVDTGGDAGYLADIGPKLREHFYGCDVLLRPLGNTVYVMPPYCTDQDDIDTIAQAISTGLDRYAR